jgi:hypothetical protein
VLYGLVAVSFEFCDQYSRSFQTPAGVNCFTENGTFTDESIGVTYRGPKELGRTVEIYAAAFPDMHRELYAFYVIGDTVVVELALQGRTRGHSNYRSGSLRRREKR